MWFVRMFLLLIVFVIVLGFALLNNANTVDIAFFVPRQAYTYEVHLILALFCTFVLGMLVWFFVSLGHDIRVRRDLSRLRKENKKLVDELNALRNLPLDEVSVKRE